MLLAFKDDYEYLAILFPGASNETINFYFELDEMITPVAHALASKEYVFSILAIISNFFHLIVLLHKSLRSISTNVIMAGIALSDIFFPISTVESKIRYFFFTYCELLQTYILAWTNLKLTIVTDFFRRTSSWLGICLAAVRVIVVTFPLNTRSIELSTTKSGFRIICLIFLLSFPLTLCMNIQYKLSDTFGDDYLGAAACPPLGPDNSTLTIYISTEIKFFIANKAIVRRVYYLINSILSKVIPCVCYPILSFILLKIVFKSSRKQKAMNRSTSHERPTTVITLLTILYVFAEFPIGIYYLTQSFITSRGIEQILSSFYYIANCLYTILSSTHLFINFFLSSQYRAAFGKVFLCGKASKFLEPKPIVMDDSYFQTVSVFQRTPPLNSINSSQARLPEVA